MIDLAYVQKKNGEFVNETVYSFWYGCRLLGIETLAFDETFGANNFANDHLSKETLVHGHIGPVKRALAHLGVEPRPAITGEPPPELASFYGRNLWTSTMGEIRTKWAEDKHVFIKPLRVQKAFTGHVTSGSVHDLIQTAGFEDDFEVMCSDPVDFVSEYRCFVHKGEIVDCRRYRGDFRIVPEIDKVGLACVKAFKSSPVAYSLDLGVTKEGRTLVVEVNDAYALGAYGMSSVPYAQMVIDRWEEMVGASGSK